MPNVSLRRTAPGPITVRRGAVEHTLQPGEELLDVPEAFARLFVAAGAQPRRAPRTGEEPDGPEPEPDDTEPAEALGAEHEES